jgi:hypothetical protein
MRNPETVRLSLSRGDWVLVKKYLTAGETRRAYTRTLKTVINGEKVALDPMQIGRSQMVEYLLDWSFEDAAGAPILIRDASPDTIAAALDALDPDAYLEVLRAVETHEAAVQVERDLEKNALAIGSGS